MRSALFEWLVFWTPRLFVIALAAFLCVFAIDVFDMPLPPLQKAAAFVIHLIPAAIVVAGLVFMWAHEWVGAAFFPLLAAVHLATRGVQMPPFHAMAIEVPLALLGALFWINWLHRAERQDASRPNGDTRAPQA